MEWITKKLKHIYDISVGVKNWAKHELVGDSLDIKKLFLYRMNMFCSTCIYKMGDFVEEPIEVNRYNAKTGKVERVMEKVEDKSKILGFKCGVCSCPFATKLRSPDSICPIVDEKYVTRHKRIVDTLESKEKLNPVEENDLRKSKLFLKQEKGWRTEEDDKDQIEKFYIRNIELFEN